MPFDHDDPYVTVEVKVLGVTAKAAKIRDEHGTVVWCPRSVMHGGDEQAIDSSVGDDMLLKVRQWFASKEGLV